MDPTTIVFQPMKSNIVETQDKCVVRSIESTGYAYITRLLTEDTLESESWESFKNSWLNGKADGFMNDSGKYRERRYAVFSYSAENECFYVEPQQPLYQPPAYNTLNGGVLRYYAHFEQHILENEVLQNILYYIVNICTDLYGLTDWHIEAHQFHIKCAKNMIGKPTPEGIHRDGRDFVFIMFIDKKNVTGGQTTIYNLNKEPVTHCTMSMESETILIDDEKLLHGVSEIGCGEEGDSGYRDVLVITFSSKAKLAESAKKYERLVYQKSDLL